MKQNKLLILSLLASFLLLISASYATAQNAVTFGNVDDCPKPAGETVLVPVMVDNDVDLAALDIIGQVVSDGNVDLVVTGITFDDRMSAASVLDQRYTFTGNPFRLGAVKLTGGNLIAGSGQVATLTCEYLSDCELGSAAIDPGELCAKTTMFAGADATLITPTVNSGAVNVVNVPPYFTFCPDPYIIYWGDAVIVTVEADDPDLTCGCDELTFSLEPGSPGSINSTTGVYQWVAMGSDVGCHTVVVKVADEYGGEAFCEFDIDVLNHPPEITCPDEVINILWGQTANAAITAVDPDGGPLGMTFSLLNPGSYPGSPDVNSVTGEFEWVTGEENAYLGLWEFCVVVTDGANLDSCNTENADTCCFWVHVDPKFRVTIDKIHDQLQGHYAEVGIRLDPSYTSMNMGGYDFLIGYDASALTFVEAMPGALLEDCDWEYFTYRFGANGNCGNACPSGLLRIVALAETNNGPNHPICFNSAAGTELAVLKFFVSNDRTFECMYAPIFFFWMDCGDNVISSQDGDTLFLEDKVFTFEGVDVTIHDGFPSRFGTSDECLVGDKDYPLRAIDFKEGGIDIVCADSIDARGDINANGVPNEIADAVMFTNYFINGLSAFGDHVEASIAASDVNADGISLSVADLVYLIRVIQGDASPYPKPDPEAETIAIKTQLINNQMNVTYNSASDLGAILLRFNVTGSVESVTLGDGASQMDVRYSVTGNELNVLVYSMSTAAIAAGSNALVSIETTGDIKLTEVDAADFYGNVLNTSSTRLPSEFALAQNYPNPFNPQTTIALDLPVATDYTVAIYNIAGQLIRTYSGYSEAGTVSLVWDGKNASGGQAASGIYFYKAIADKYISTKKMILMK
jgi:hypothetical protein